MREIVLDTETTGFDAEGADRIVELGAVELWNHVPTGKTYHQYVNPMRSMPAEAFAVHGLGDEFLRDKPVFAEVGAAFAEFLGDAKLVIHNAEFDMRFMNAEFRRAGMKVLAADRAVDTLAICKKRFPGSPSTLDALCRRFGIDNSGRELHGALLDSQLLAEVYLELIGGKQPDFGLSAGAGRQAGPSGVGAGWRAPARPRALAPRITEAEAVAHAAFVAELGDGALWGRAS